MPAAPFDPEAGYGLKVWSRSLLMHRVFVPVSRARFRAGSSNAISRAMIEITTSSSMRVKPTRARMGSPDYSRLTVTPLRMLLAIGVGAVSLWSTRTIGIMGTEVAVGQEKVRSAQEQESAAREQVELLKASLTEVRQHQAQLAESQPQSGGFMSLFTNPPSE